MRFALRALKVALVNLLIAIALLVPIELYFGTWFSGRGAISKFDAQPNTVEKFTDNAFYPPGTTTVFRRDGYGLRGAPANPADIDVLAIGGSTTIEHYTDENDTWTAVLERLLREEGCKTTIANAGIDGYATAGNIASFDGWLDRIPGLKPHFILVYLGINDAIANPDKANFLNSERYPGHWRQLQHYVAAHSALHQLYTTLRGWLRARRAKLPYGRSPPPRTLIWQSASLPSDFDTLVAKKVERYRERLTELNRVIHDFGARPIYITQKRADGRLVDSQWQELAGSQGARDAATLAAINEATLAFCRDTGETCIDLAGRLELPPEEFSDSIHTSPAGSARIARFLAASLSPILCRRADR